MNDLTKTLKNLVDSLTYGELENVVAGDEDFPAVPRDTRTFEEVGVLTSDDGFVVTLADGTEYRVTVVRSR